MEAEAQTQVRKAEHTASGDPRKRAFLMKALRDALGEMSGIEETGGLLKSFLLMAMGDTGAVQGFAIVTGPRAEECKLAHQGWELSEMERLREHLPLIPNHLTQTSGRLEYESTAVGPQLITSRGIEDPSLFPAGTRVLIQWRTDPEHLGLLGLGAKIVEEGYDEEDIEFLLTLTGGLALSLRNATSLQLIHSLDANLHKRDLETAELIRQSEARQKELDSRIFHLNALYEAIRELKDLRGTEGMIKTFLLMVIGNLSLDGGYVLLVDQGRKAINMLYRGAGYDTLNRMPGDALEGLAERFFKAAKDKGIKPMSASLAAERTLIEQPGLSDEARTGVLFAIDETCIGFLGLGQRMTGTGLGQAEQDLLLAITHNFLVFLKNAKLFDSIKELKLDVDKGNIELGKAAEELSGTRVRLEKIERAKAQIKSVIHREMERSKRVALTDFALILGFALALGILFNLANPAGIDLIPLTWSHNPSPAIDVHWARLKYDRGSTIFVDARPAEFFNERHIKGAINLSPNLFDFVYRMKLSNVDPKDEIVVYGRNISRLYDEEVAFKLTSRGHGNIRILLGGLPAWKERGYPLGP
ncbi:MAG: Rhodanese-like protein [Thermodesulfobacteriota bacterium]|nr:Rhodanese-like protein [Thermodesulfobacteriota bacterium]